jgi:choline dehydrogenase-like flavoprotein
MDDRDPRSRPSFLDMTNSASLARELIGNGGRVSLLDSGGKDMERRAQRLDREQSVGYLIHRPHQSRVRAFGGTTRHWVGPGDEAWAARPLDPIHFDIRPGIRHSGWPFDRAHLDPYYAQAQGLCRVGPFDYDPGRWADQTRTPPLPLPAGAVETTLFQHGTAGFEGYYQELVRAPNVSLLLHAFVVDLATGERCSNPTLTVVALALRLADHLKTQLAG